MVQRNISDSLYLYRRTSDVNSNYRKLLLVDCNLTPEYIRGRNSFFYGYQHYNTYAIYNKTSRDV